MNERTIEQYKEYINTVKYWQSIKKYDGKKTKKSIRHWFITELGENTGRIHLHGIIWTELTEEQFEKEWGYGWIFFGHEVNERTVNYIVKNVAYRDWETDRKSVV